MSSVRPTAKFFQVDDPSTNALARFGPFLRTGTTGQLLNAYAYINKGQFAPYGLDGPCRFLRFPGVLRSEAPARGELVMLAPADITNNATITLDDGGGNVGVFRLRKSGANPGTDIDVNITAATTAAEVATALAAAITTWTATLIDPEAGFSTTATDATVGLVQASQHKVANSAQSRAWLGITWGSFGNVPIVADAGTVVSATGMTGGKPRQAGLQPIFLVNRRVTFQPTYYAPIKDGG